MSARVVPPIPVVEWSPEGVRAFLPQKGKVISGRSLAEIRSQLEGGEVVFAIARRSAFLRTTRLPDAPKSDVSKILALQVGQLFPVSPAEAAVDFYLTDDRNSEGRLAVVAAVKRDVLAALNEDMTQNGLSARAIVPAALGSAYLARDLGLSQCAVVENAVDGLAIDVIAERELRTSRVVPPPNAHMVDEEVMRAFAIAKVPCSEAVAAGGLTYAEAGRTLPKSSLEWLSAVALPLNLEPPELVQKRAADRLARARRVAIILWLAAFLLGAVVWDFYSRDHDVVRKGEEKWKKTLSALRKTKDQAAAKYSSISKVDTALSLGFEPKQRMSDIAALLSNLAPEGLWLTGLTLERGKLATIRGTALTGDMVTKYLERLSTQNRLRDVKLAFANNGQIEKTNVVQFSMTAHIVGNLPLDTEVLK